MAKIRQLDDVLSNKIAAGEVVERPASVVKELVENSIDAASSCIDIFIEEGGLSLIKVVDNGDGMSFEDAKMCFMRHATSKIKDDHDLFHIYTLGFRGEAIPSIASVSHFDLRTSMGDEGHFVQYKFGKLVDLGICDLAKGTQITISQLFQNVPARLKYMKSVNTEFSVIHQYIERLALAYPNIAFSLYHNQKLVFKTNGKGQLLEVIASMYGLATAKNMIPININDDEFKVSGYISKIDTSRASKGHMITLVNHRYVRNAMSIDTVNDVYRQYLADRRYPIVVLNIGVDPYLVDVNVHPAKLEVRFSREQELKQLLNDGVNKALKEVNLTYQLKNKVTERESFKPQVEQASFVFDHPLVSEKRIDCIKEEESSFTSNPIIKEEVIQKEEPIVYKEDIKKDYVVKEKPLKEKIYAKVQIRGTYLLGENDKGVYLLDQHAAMERINYEYYKERFALLDLRMQPLIVPLQLEYPMSDFLLLEERKGLLEQVGIYLEVFSSHGYIVRELPLWMKNIDENIFVDEMIQEVLSKNQLDVVALREHAIATLSCKASLKANTYLNLSDMQMIFDRLMRCDNPYVCPHGRPTLIYYSDYELEKLFKRVV